MTQKIWRGNKPQKRAQTDDAQQERLALFAGQHTNERANDRRHVKALLGARQYRKQRKALAKAAREMA